MTGEVGEGGGGLSEVWWEVVDGVVDVDADAGDDGAVGAGEGGLAEDAGELSSGVAPEVVGPFESEGEFGEEVVEGLMEGDGGEECDLWDGLWWCGGSEDGGEVEVESGG